jgi:hypothetical protein
MERAEVDARGGTTRSCSTTVTGDEAEWLVERLGWTGLAS